MKRLACIFAIISTLSACDHTDRSRFPTAASPLGLSRVVLYRNGVGYFERQGEIDGNLLKIRVRKDQINDLLKSLTIVDRKSGQAVSVSMPLDPETWARAALGTLGPGNGSLAQLLDRLRGTEVELDTVLGTMEGRVVIVEAIQEEPDPTMPAPRGNAKGSGAVLGYDHKVTIMEGQEMSVVRLSKIKTVKLKDGDLAMQFHRRLDAAAGEGMFQQVEIAIRLDNAASHDLVVSYVVEAPIWKPTYRVVLPEDGKGEALLQAWAVVDNTSGEDWREVQLSLTAGEPLAFRYDLHTPREVFRQDLTSMGTQRRGRVAMGETTYAEDEESPAEEPEADELAAASEKSELGSTGFGRGAGGMRAPRGAPSPAKPSSRASRYRGEKKKDKGYGPRQTASSRDRGNYGVLGDAVDGDVSLREQQMTLDNLRRSTRARTRAATAAGLTRFDLQNPVTVPDGNSTMVAIVNQSVKGEQAFLFNPGGSGTGFEQNPYRAVRFSNTTPFVLEPGPISIYSGGSFVGEGLSDRVGTKTSVTVPFAVEPGIMVTRKQSRMPHELKLVKIVRGVLKVDRFTRVKTTWQVQSQTMNEGFKVLIKHPQYGSNFKLKDRPNDTEDLPNAYLVPVSVPPGTKKAAIELVEQSPTRTSIAIMDRDTLPMLERAMVAGNLDAADRAKLEPIIAKRQEAGKIVESINAKRRLQRQLKVQMDEARKNLAVLKEMKDAKAKRMAQERARKLEDWTNEHDKLGREIIELEPQVTQIGIELSDMLQNLTIE